MPDEEIVRYATKNKLLVFTYDSDYLKIALEFQENKIEFSGIIYATANSIRFENCINDLEIISKLGDENDFKNLVTFLPY